MAEKRPPLPLLLTAQDLRAGHAVYWNGTDWSERIEDGLIAQDEAAAEALEGARANADRALVLDAFLFTFRDGHPAHFRERARAIGPSFRNDFGRTPQGADRVPL